MYIPGYGPDFKQPVVTETAFRCAVVDLHFDCCCARVEYTVNSFNFVSVAFWVVADGMTEVSFRRLPALLCLYC